MAFHAAMYVSATHSSASSCERRILYVTALRYAPYFFAVSATALSARAKYSAMMSLSCIVCISLLFVVRPYTLIVG